MEGHEIIEVMRVVAYIAAGYFFGLLAASSRD